MTTGANGQRRTWTEIGLRSGLTSERHQRDEILAAIERMAWTPTAVRVPHLHGDAARAMVNAVFSYRCGQLRLVGVTHLSGDRRLVGFEDRFGSRSYLLDLDSDAVYVLAETSRPPVTPQQANAA